MTSFPWSTPSTAQLPSATLSCQADLQAYLETTAPIEPVLLKARIAALWGSPSLVDAVSHALNVLHSGFSGPTLAAFTGRLERAAVDDWFACVAVAPPEHWRAVALVLALGPGRAATLAGMGRDAFARRWRKVVPQLGYPNWGEGERSPVPLIGTPPSDALALAGAAVAGSYGDPSPSSGAAAEDDVVEVAASADLRHVVGQAVAEAVLEAGPAAVHAAGQAAAQSVGAQIRQEAPSFLGAASVSAARLAARHIEERLAAEAPEAIRNQAEAAASEAVSRLSAEAHSAAAAAVERAVREVEARSEAKHIAVRAEMQAAVDEIRRQSAAAIAAAKQEAAAAIAAAAERQALAGGANVDPSSKPRPDGNGGGWTETRGRPLAAGAPRTAGLASPVGSRAPDRASRALSTASSLWTDSDEADDGDDASLFTAPRAGATGRVSGAAGGGARGRKADDDAEVEPDDLHIFTHKPEVWNRVVAQSDDPGEALADIRAGWKEVVGRLPVGEKPTGTALWKALRRAIRDPASLDKGTWKVIRRFAVRAIFPAKEAAKMLQVAEQRQKLPADLRQAAAVSFATRLAISPGNGGPGLDTAVEAGLTGALEAAERRVGKPAAKPGAKSGGKPGGKRTKQ